MASVCPKRAGYDVRPAGVSVIQASPRFCLKFQRRGDTSWVAPHGVHGAKVTHRWACGEVFGRQHLCLYRKRNSDPLPSRIRVCLSNISEGESLLKCLGPRLIWIMRGWSGSVNSLHKRAPIFFVFIFYLDATICIFLLAPNKQNSDLCFAVCWADFMYILTVVLHSKRL